LYIDLIKPDKMFTIKIQTVVLLSAIGLVSSTQAQTNSYRYNFNQGLSKKGYTTVSNENIYSADKGFGFDQGTAIPLELAGTSNPFYFSVKVPEGNYQVTIKFGDPMRDAASTVKAESRRLMLENISTPAGKYLSKSFIVNIKDRQIAGQGQVRLKPREFDKLDWDGKLTLEFDQQTALQSIEIVPVNNQITLYLCGNSTVVNQEDEPWASWGQMITRFFKPGIAVANHAESGLTLGSFLGSLRLEKIMSVIKPGDYLFVEFGHNDQKDKGPNDGAWKSYTERLRLFVQQARAKGAVPVIITSTSRRSFGPDNKIINSLGDFPAAARSLAAEEKVALIDLNLMSTRLYEALGVEPSKKAFVHYPANSYPGQDKALADNTHFNPYGAYELAKCVIQGIRDNHLGIEKFIADGLPEFDPSHPDSPAAFAWYESPARQIVKPDGN
jgi:lysophospholipase L1-like esterase